MRQVSCEVTQAFMLCVGIYKHAGLPHIIVLTHDCDILKYVCYNGGNSCLHSDQGIAL